MLRGFFVCLCVSELLYCLGKGHHSFKWVHSFPFNLLLYANIKVYVLVAKISFVGTDPLGLLYCIHAIGFLGAIVSLFFIHKFQCSVCRLGDVMASLTSKKDNIPYENSVLTKVLADSLGNSCPCSGF